MKRKPKRVDKRTDADRDSVKLTLRLPRETVTLIGILAELRGLSRCAYVAELVERADLEHARRAAEG